MSNERVISEYEMEMIWKKAVVAYLMVITRNLPEESEEYHEKPLSG
jgi:hypothetical protein